MWYRRSEAQLLTLQFIYLNKKLTLIDLPVGEKAIVSNENVALLPLKLVEFGCIPGNEIEVLQFAPFKDPIYIKVNDAFLAIRKEVAKLIEVSVLEVKG